MTDFSSLISDVSFGAATALTGYLSWRCLTPPIPTPPPASSSSSAATAATSHRQDLQAEKKQPSKVRGDSDGPPPIDTLTATPFFALTIVYRTLFLMLTSWQALVCISPRFAPSTPPAQPLNPILFHWNPISTAVFIIIWAGSTLRLRAMSELNADFTFELRLPSRLKTDGLYKFVQHPSYTGGVPAIAGAACWFLRCDGVLGFVVPGWMAEKQWFFNWVAIANVAGACAVVVLVRVREEERMLKGVFGREWVEWHRRTARFVPFLF